jgi:hypothetical protein
MRCRPHPNSSEISHPLLFVPSMLGYCPALLESGC